MRLRKLARLCPHDQMAEHFILPTIWSKEKTAENWCPGGEFLADDTLAIDTAMPAGRLERQRNDELRAALGKGHMAPWEQDIERLLNRGDSILDALAVREESEAEKFVKRQWDALAVREGEGPAYPSMKVSYGEIVREVAE